MPTPLRIAYPGAVYHVISRGNDRTDIFRDDADRKCYLDLLCGAVSAYKLKIYAYVLMSNHVHLFLKTLLPNISEAMYRINLDYTVYFNHKHGKTGHLFETRFKGKIVQEDRYFLSLLRYIHLNPVKAGIVSSPEKYEWSSHRGYLSGSDRIIGNPTGTLMFFSENPFSAKNAYMDFLGQTVPEKEWEMLDRERNGILGDLQFRQSLKKAAGAF
ncbi:MAG TPA: transposase [Elusimicrobia bacterium]|nr:transposase [Elusimicrobiota bacterium]